MTGPVPYAENVLGVHTIHETALEARKKLDDILTQLSEAKDKKRKMEIEMSDLEMALASEERGKNPETSATAFKEHLKTVFHGSTDWVFFRDELSLMSGDIEGLEYDKSVTSKDIDIATARMEELGGYLHYLAVAKQASMTSAASKAS